MSSGSGLGLEVENPPLDGISNLRFSLTSDTLLASSWDGTARLYEAPGGQSKATFTHGAPLLDATFQSDSALLTAGLDGKLKRFDVSSGSEAVIGTHDQPVRCVEWLADRQLVASSSWDCTLRVWDPRLPPGQNCVAHIPLPGKAFSMSHSGSRLVVATSQRQVLAYDIRRIETGQADIDRESSLKFQTRCLRCFPDGKGYAISSVEGRVAVEYFDMSEAGQAKKFAFKCHRRNENGVDMAYPVNTMAFHPTLGTFVTGGCDGVVNVWDPENKKRLFQVAGYPTSIAGLAFNHDGSQLAIASSYTFEYGEKEHPADAIYVRAMVEAEVKPKPRR